MASDPKGPIKVTGGADKPTANTDHALQLLRTLLPFPSSGLPLSLLEPLAMPLLGGNRSAATMPAAIPAAAIAAAEDIVSAAASILDDEMARGVLAARGATPEVREQQSGSGLGMRQLHELVDQIASAWPGWGGITRPPWPGSGAPPTAHPQSSVAAELKPPQSVPSGGHATISMAVANDEEHPVHLRPAVTDLIGPRGRIAARALACVPDEITLAPRQRVDLRIDVSIPRDSGSGLYHGLLVINGVDDLRALLTIRVV